VDRAQVLATVIYPAMREIAPTLRSDVTYREDPDATLFGKDGVIDSLGLVTLVVAVEQRVAAAYGKQITLASQQAMSRSSSPFRTLGRLADYVIELVAAA
jgi:acyl carrier protein